MPEQPSLHADITAVLQRGITPLAEAAFNALALRVFRFQFENNPPYRKYCERRLASADAVRRWQDIPAVPTAAFKEAKLVCGDPASAEAVFRTSGTTRGAEKRGAHFVLDLELYRRSLLPTFRAYVLNERDGVAMLSLVPPYTLSPDSSLSYMITTVMRELGSKESIYAVNQSGIQIDVVRSWLERQIARNEPVCVLGTSLAFVHLFDEMTARGNRVALPPGSRVMDTGGFKGSERSITAEELRGLYADILGVPAAHVINEYGMTEMLSQFYDDGPIKRGPPWVRSMVVHPDTLQELPHGDVGLLRHVDLANLLSAAAIQTEDLGRVSGAGFELLGRVAGATPRGCSIAMDLFLRAAQ